MVLKPKAVKAMIEGGTLYPTVAISDGWMVLTHLYASHTCYGAMLYPAATALMWIAITAAIGCLRFGYNETVFRPMHGHCSDIAGFSAIPIIGLQFYGLDDEFCMLPLIIFPLSRLLRMKKGDEVTRCPAADATFGPSETPPCHSRRCFYAVQVEQAAKIAVNVACFVLPVLLFAYETRDRICYLTCLVFVINGIFIGTDCHSYIFGVRRVNIFHYVLGASMCLMAVRLCRVFNPN